MSSDPFVVAVVGATATGKSDLADRLAARFGSAVISADSMQIYRGLDIGTAKLATNQRRAPHFGIDIVDLNQAYSAAQFQRYARSLIDRYLAQQTIPVVCGGTGLYLRAALDDMRFPAGEQLDNEPRIRWTAFAQQHGEDALFAQLKQRDPASAALLHPHNRKRVIRALELYEGGESYAQQAAHFKERTAWYRTCSIGLTMDRALLYRRIDERVDDMLAQGLVDEAYALFEAGLADTYTARHAIGYKELFAYFEKTCTLEEAIEAIKRHSRRYAKRQSTWFRDDARVQWIEVDGIEGDALERRALEIVEDFKAKGIDEDCV